MSIQLKVPNVGESVTEVYIGQWYKSEGDTVAADEDVVELESDKATFDAPSPAAGTITKILKQSGETAEVGEVIAEIDESTAGASKAESSEQSEDAEAGTDEVVSEERPKKESAGRGVVRSTSKSASDEIEKSRPQAADQADKAERSERKGAAKPKRDSNQAHAPADNKQPKRAKPHVRPTTARRVQAPENESAEETDQDDRESASKDAQPQPVEAKKESNGREQRVPMTPIRRRIAQRLVEAQQSAALLTTFNECDMTAVNDLRRQYGDAFLEKYDVKLGFMSFFVKAVIAALEEIPQLNAAIDGDDIVYHDFFDIGIAIGTDKGLVVPVLRDAETLGFAEIEQAIAEMAERAREGRLKVAELQGGTFTISNGGIYGSLLSTPLVNPPQSGVLGMHAIQERPVVRDGQIVIRPMMYIALTYDHRIVDGKEAVTFLRRVKESIEAPARMLIEA